MGKESKNICVDGKSVRSTFTDNTTEKPVKRAVNFNHQEVTDYLGWLDKFERESMQSRLVVK